MPMPAEPIDTAHLPMLADVVVRPTFVMGDHRTGTTILYKLLGASGCFNIVTAYHIIKYGELLDNFVHGRVEAAKRELAEEFARRGLRDRGIDHLQADPDMPEEYGFILRNTSWRLWLRPDNVADLVELCKKIQLTSDPGRALLLKNPWDFFLNFLFVKEQFPSSSFVFIHRNPIQTVNSQIRAIRSVLRTRNEYVRMIAPWYRGLISRPHRLLAARLFFSSHFNLGVRNVTRHVARGTSYFLEHIASLPAAEVICVRYEDLCREPSRTVRSILDRLGLREPHPVDYARWIRERRLPLLDEVARSRDYIYGQTRPYCDYWGYSGADAA